MKFLKKFFSNKNTIEEPLKIVIRSGVLPVQVVRVGEALNEWRSHAERFETTKVWPVLIGPIDQIIERFQSDADDLEPRENVLAASRSIDGLSACRQRCLDRFDDKAEIDEVTQEIGLDFESQGLVIPMTTRLSATILTGIGEEEPEFVGLALIPCSEPYEVLANLAFGDWNDCPTDSEHVAVHRNWYDKFGAVPFGLQPDVIELFIPEPIMDPEVAARLAREMYYYAPDIVEQGTETVQALAQEILGSSIWFFWWD